MNYVVSDIHGDRESFLSILKQIDLRESDTLHILGDVLDGGEHGVEILQMIMGMPNVRCLLGNHELLCLNAMIPHREELPWTRNDPDWDLLAWLHAGGRVTLKAMQAAGTAAVDEMLRYLRALPVQYDIEVKGRRFRLVHASPMELFPEDGSSGFCDAVNYAVWNRRPELSRLSDDCTLVFGHTPTALLRGRPELRIWHGPRAIGLDCGCGSDAGAWLPDRGRLACLRLDDMKEYYSDDICDGAPPV